RHRGPIGARVGFSAGLQQGAEIGLAVQYSLAILHLYGYGVPQSLIEAAKWFEKAGDQGDASSGYASASTVRHILDKTQLAVR
ncbi:MAG: SEL1-like repeat protein, partial [Methylocella sp.]